MSTKHTTIPVLLAIILSQAIMAQDIDSAEVHFKRAEALLQSKQYDQAIKELRVTIRLNPDWPEAHFKLGLAYYAISPKDAELEGNGKRSIGFGLDGNPGQNLKAAIVALEEALRLKPDWPEALNYLAASYRGFQADDRAILLLKNALRLKPDFFDAQENLGMAYLYAGRYSDGIEHLNKAITLNPALPRPHKLLGLTYVILDDKEKALEQYKMLQTLDQDMAKDLERWIQSSDKPYVGVVNLLNHKLLPGVQLHYPAIARNSGISGEVIVEVVVDESGKVISARSLSGPQVMREAAETAARTARFKRTEILGTAVAVKGVVMFAFRHGAY